MGTSFGSMGLLPWVLVPNLRAATPCGWDTFKHDDFFPAAGIRTMVTFTLNGRPQEVDVSEDTPLLWVLRDTIKLTGTKFGCGMGLCGACTVHVDGTPTRSCMTPVGTISGADVTTIEGLSSDGSHPVQQAWVEEQVPQCGYCQSGQIMSAVGLLAETEHPTDEDIDRAMTGNVCRCGAYNAIRRAIHRAAELSEEAPLMAEGAEQGGDR